MQKTPKKLQLLRKKGISLLIAVIISFFVLSMTMTILISVNKSLQNAVGLERFNQATFAAESGMEAAFFHHNARGQGVHFGEISTVGQDQTISFPDGDIKWSLLGRTDDQVYPKILTGILKENQTVTLPLSFDNTSNVSTDPNSNLSQNYADSAEDFKLLFSRRLFETNGSRSILSADTYVEQHFDFSLSKNEPIINWSISRFNDDGDLQTFIPTTILKLGKLPCAQDAFRNTFFQSNDTGYICRDHFSNLTATAFVSINTTSAIPGKILPGNHLVTLKKFIDGTDDYSGNGTNSKQKFTLNFRPLVPFENSVGEKIKGIPWALIMDKLPGAINGTPKYYYEAEVLSVDRQDYRRYVRTKVMEETAVGVLDVLTLD
jgi:hypothetical protein